MPQGNNRLECVNSNKYNNNKELTSPILSNESFSFNYSAKSGVELEFKPRLER